VSTRNTVLESVREPLALEPVVHAHGGPQLKVIAMDFLRGGGVNGLRRSRRREMGQQGGWRWVFPLSLSI